jgi:hypothetical protein
MRGLRGMFVGVLTLIALETIVSTAGAASRTSGLLRSTANGVAHLLDPNMAAIPIVGVPKSARWIGHAPAGGSSTSGATYSTVPPADRAPIVAPPPANNKPKPPKSARVT